MDTFTAFMSLFMVLFVTIIVTYSLYKWTEITAYNTITWFLYFLSIAISHIVFYIGATYNNFLIYLGIILLIVNFFVLREILFRKHKFQYFKKIGYVVFSLLLVLIVTDMVVFREVPRSFSYYIVGLLIFYLNIFFKMIIAYMKDRDFIYLIYVISVFVPLLFVVVEIVIYGFTNSIIESSGVFYFKASFLFMLLFHFIMLLVAIIYQLNHNLIASLENKEAILIKKNEKLESLATVDYLTKLYNRRYLNGVISKEAFRHNRFGGNLSVIIFDIDFFKKINDRYGHDVGDYVLKKISEIISNSIRNVDTFGRWGGEEFILLLPNTSEEQSFNKAEKLRKMIESYPFQYGISITCSFGVASKLQGESYTSWIKHADIALYEAKKSGRNLTVKYAHSMTTINLSQKVEWTPEMLSGIDEIDDDHKLLVKLIKQFDDETLSKQEILSLLQNLIDETVKHFDEEETIMENYHFPGLEHHRKVHKYLAYNASIIVRNYESNKIQNIQVVKLTIRDLVMEHMIHEDSKFFLYLKKTNQMN